MLTFVFYEYFACRLCMQEIIVKKKCVCLVVIFRVLACQLYLDCVLHICFMVCVPLYSCMYFLENHYHYCERVYTDVTIEFKSIKHVCKHCYNGSSFPRQRQHVTILLHVNQFAFISVSSIACVFSCLAYSRRRHV